MKFFFVTILFLLFTCCNNKEKVASKIPLLTKDTTRKLEKENTLFAFVGEKITVRFSKEYSTDFDGAFIAKYKIIQRVYGDFQRDTIEFVAYDHFGDPEFAKYKNVLLFVSRDSLGYYHEKYMFNDVYLINDEWIGTYPSLGYGHDFNINTTIKPIKVDFPRAAWKKLSGDKWLDSTRYPTPYYKIEGKHVIPLYGNSLKELFLLTKNGVLTARGLFGDTLISFENEIQEIEIEPVP